MDRLRVLANHFNSGDEEGQEQAGVLVRQPTLAGKPYQGFSYAQPMYVFPPAAHDVFNVDEFLTPTERDIRYRVRAFAEKEVAPIIADYWERAEFPHHLVPKMAELNIAGGTIAGYGCPGATVMGAAMANIELARVDGSMSTFILVHSSLCMLTIALLGSEQQKQEHLPKLASLEWIGCWGLTEPSNGSDASALTTTATKVDGGWVLRGYKRWIGNATFAEVTIIWARNTGTGQVNAFIVRKGNPGCVATKIKNKIALRCVQNGDIALTDCFVPDSARLPGVNGFQDTAKVLAISRIMVAWQPVGVAMGIYDMCARYVKERQQFGTPIGSFQLVQEKLARMLGDVQAMFLMCWRLSKMHEQGKMTHAMASTVKAWTTMRGRQVAALGRELLGGNGIVSDFLVAKAFCDVEAYYTYEGTYEVNALVSGRDITGIAAFKVPLRKK